MFLVWCHARESEDKTNFNILGTESHKKRKEIRGAGKLVFYSIYVDALYTGNIY